MFLPHCHHIAFFPDPKSLQYSMQLIAAFAGERELQDRWEREQLEKSENEKQNAPAPRPY